MKVVINKCFGEFSLSPKAVRRMAELAGKECHFYKFDLKAKEYVPITEAEATADRHMWCAFDHRLSDTRENGGRVWCAMTDDEKTAANRWHNEHSLENRPEKRDDPLLIQVVEELGEDADGSCAELKVVEIPDGISYEIGEYDGVEHIAETHRTWA